MMILLIGFCGLLASMMALAETGAAMEAELRRIARELDFYRPRIGVDHEDV